MNKVIGFELKKMVSRPGIYVLAVLLALLLTVTAFIYKPYEEKKVYNKLDGNTLVAVDADFNNNYKASYDKIVADTLLLAQEVNATTHTEYKENLTTLLIQYLSDCENFINRTTNVMYAEKDLKEALEKVSNSAKNGSLDVLYTRILELVGKEEDEFRAITILNSDYTALLTAFDNIAITISNGQYSSIARELYNKLNPELKACFDKIKYPDNTKSIEKYLTNGNYLNVTNERLEVIVRKMNELVAKVSTEEHANDNLNYVKEYNDLFNEYRFNCELYHNLLITDLNLNTYECFSKNSRVDVKFFNTTDYYTQLENKTRYTYYFEKDKLDSEFANALSFDYASNEKANGYDYTYFALSIFSVILIAFAITLASHSIAGETNEGTMRFVSIRPVSRGKILLGKFFAIAIMTFIMLIFSSTASFVVGAFTFGLNSAKILTVINATKVIVLHPIVSLLIFVSSQYLILLVYTSVAMLLTSFLKSDLLTLVLTLLLYVVNLLVPIFFNYNSFLRFNPFTNINLYAYVGAGTRLAKTIVGKMFTSVVYSGMTIWLSSIFIVAFIVVFNLLAVSLFKRREL